MVNWRVRFKNKNFWLAIVPAILLFIQAVTKLFGYTLDLGALGDKIIDVVNTLFVVLSVIGVVNDPTTQGIGDSNRALTYDKPV